MAHLDLAVSAHASLQKQFNTVSLSEHLLWTASSDHLIDVDFHSGLGSGWATPKLYSLSRTFIDLEGCFRLVSN